MKCYRLEGDDEILLAARNPGYSRSSVPGISIRAGSISWVLELAQPGVQGAAGR